MKLQQIKMENGACVLDGDYISCGTVLRVLLPGRAAAETRFEISCTDEPYFVGLPGVDVVGSWAERI